MTFMQPKGLSLVPSLWRQPHLDLVGARVIFPADPLALSAEFHLPSVPDEHDFRDLVSGQPTGYTDADNEYSTVRFQSERLENQKRLVEDPKMCFYYGCISTYFLDFIIQYLMPEHHSYPQAKLTLRLGEQVVKWYPLCMVGDMFAMVKVERPTSEFAEETAYCLSLAQHAQRSKGWVGVKCTAGFALPSVVSIRDGRVVVVMAKLEVGILEKIEASVVHKNKGGQARGGGMQGFDVYALKWDSHYLRR